MLKYKCKKCGYSGDELIFTWNEYSYCIASNEEEPEYISRPPKWANDGDAEIGDPVGCPKCKAWGTDNFKMIE